MKNIQEQLFDKVGECCENFTWDKTDSNKVQVILNDCLEKILGIVPLSCFAVINIKKYIKTKDGYKQSEG